MKGTKRIKNSERPPLGEILALLLRSAREGQGYGIAKLDRAIAHALLVEAMQRAAMVTETPAGEAPDNGAILEIFSVMLQDVRDEAEKMLRGRLN